MRELSLHVLDLLQNSVEAGAVHIGLSITEDRSKNRLEVVVEDDGRGIPEEMIEQIMSPFVTSRTTRKFGLGLSLLQATARQCEGDLGIESQVGKGTRVTAWFERDHIDLPPLGDLAGTITVFLVGRDDLSFSYMHSLDGRKYTFDSTEHTESMNNPLKLLGLKEEIEGALAQLQKEAGLEDSR